MTDAELNTAVARACGYKAGIINDRCRVWTIEEQWEGFDPLNEWRDCGPLIARFRLEVWETEAIIRDGRYVTGWQVAESESESVRRGTEKGDDPDASLRRAICEAVAEIGRAEIPPKETRLTGAPPA